MPSYLVALSLGPVQSLIGAARRTRDLWCGSWLLSEASRAAARTLDQASPGCLVFPALTGETLEPQGGPANDGANVSNVLRAEVELPDSAAVRMLCDNAKAAAAARLRELGETARSGLPIREEVWQAQIDDILEGFAAWVIIGEGGYQVATKSLGATLAARKATRDFRQCSPLSVAGLPKSSLDGALETVLCKAIGPTDRRRLGLSDNEQLDALGVMKRLAGQVEQFTPYSRIAADPWIRNLEERQQQRLREAYEPLVKLGLATRVSGNDRTYKALPFDAQLLYASRLETVRPQGGDDLAALEALRDRVAEARRASGGSEPAPYAAILKADGDRMGEFLSRATSAEQSRRMSRSLHGFASQVRQIVRGHRGHAIYAGGDDVLALLPLANALDCAKELAEQFQEQMQPNKLGVDSADGPTLSVGIGIGHLMEPLGALRSRAERAEALAKGDTRSAPRNALAIALGVRSGGEHCWRANWSDQAAINDLAQATRAFANKALPSRIAYDLRGIEQRAWLHIEASRRREMGHAEVDRLLDRARVPGTDQRIGNELRELLLRRVSAEELAATAEMLIVARWLAARTAADVGER